MGKSIVKQVCSIFNYFRPLEHHSNGVFSLLTSNRIKIIIFKFFIIGMISFGWAVVRSVYQLNLVFIIPVNEQANLYQASNRRWDYWKSITQHLGVKY